MKACKSIKMNLRKILILTLLISLNYTVEIKAGEPVTHLLICCRSTNRGATWLINEDWNSHHDYRDINVVRDVLQKVKDAGINTVSIDMTNPSMWHSEQQRALHMPMCDNVRTVAAEKGMQYFIFIGGQISYALQDLINDKVPGVYPGMTGVAYWNMIAAEVLTWANADSHYKKYGFDGDNRPILNIFLPGEWWAIDIANAPASDKNNLIQFRHGTHEINGENLNPVSTDGWGYRNDIQNTDGSIRFTSPNRGVHPDNYNRLTRTEFREHVQWVKGASKYSIYGSYDDVCDEINWGISDTRTSTVTTNLYPEHEPTAYYNIIQEELVGCSAPLGNNNGTGLHAQYFNSNDFSGIAVKENLQNINHNWQTNSPGTGVNSDNFSVRLSGKIEAPFSGYYTFFGNADDYEKLTVNGKVVFEDNNATTQEVGTVPLRLIAGQLYDITYEMKEGVGAASMKLEWTTACLPRQVVPLGRLFNTNTNNWHFTSSMEGWTPLSQMTATASNSIATATITGADPFMHSPDNLNISATDYKYVVVSMRNQTASTTAELFWITTLATGYDGAKMVQFPVVANDTKQRTYIIDLSAKATWTGTIKQLRLDPTTTVTSGTVKIDFIKFVGTHHSSPLAIPGTIQVEDFNKGGQGNAYNDNDIANNGGGYRTTEGVDIETTGDATGSYNIGWTAPGEWTEYLVDVSEPGTYIVTTRAAAAADGAEIRLQFNGENIGNAIQLANTGGFQVYANNEISVELTQGKQILRLASGTGGYNSNYITFQKQAIAITPFTQVNGGAWVETNTATLCSGTAVSFGPHPVVANGWTWTGPNGFAANTRVIAINSVQYTHSGSYTATYSDAHSSTATQEFNLTVQELPLAAITTQDALNGENNGAITLSFNDNPNRTNIAFSINDGVNYASVADNSGSYTFGDLAHGAYSVWARWGNTECPVNLGSYNIGNQDTDGPVGSKLQPSTASEKENQINSQAYDLQGRKIQGAPKGLWLDSSRKLRFTF
jgi:hypothetical protein